MKENIKSMFCVRGSLALALAHPPSIRGPGYVYLCGLGVASIVVAVLLKRLTFTRVYVQMQ